MKKVLLFLTGLILLSMVTNAQQSSGKCYDENTKIVGIGIGLGYNYYSGYKGAGYTSHNLPALSITYEQAWPKKLGPGYLGVGAYFGIKSSNYTYDWNYISGNYYQKWHYNNIMIASRAAYHWDGLIFDKAQVYGGFILGLRIETDKYEYSDPLSNGVVNSTTSNVHLAWAMFAGARYYFAPKVSVFGELGYGISYLTVGVGFKL